MRTRAGPLEMLDGNSVLGQYDGFSAFVPSQPVFQGVLCSKAHRKIRPVLEVDRDFGTLRSTPVKMDRTDHSTCNVLALEHDNTLVDSTERENITLIVCRLIVVYPQALGSAESFNQVPLWNSRTRSTRGARLFAGGFGGTGRFTSQLRGQRRAGRTKRRIGKHCEAGRGAFDPHKRPVRFTSLNLVPVSGSIVAAPSQSVKRLPSQPLALCNVSQLIIY